MQENFNDKERELLAKFEKMKPYLEYKEKSTNLSPKAGNQDIRSQYSTQEQFGIENRDPKLRITSQNPNKSEDGFYSDFNQSPLKW